MTHRFFSIYEDCVGVLSCMRGGDLSVFMACCVVASFGECDFTLRRSGKRVCELSGVSSVARDVSLGRLVGVGVLIRPRRGYYVVNPYVCYKGSDRRELLRKWDFVDLGADKGVMSVVNEKRLQEEFLSL